MNQADLSAALAIGTTVRVTLRDGRTLQGLLEEARAGGDGEPGSLRFRPPVGTPSRSHAFAGPEDVVSVEPLPGGEKARGRA